MLNKFVTHINKYAPITTEEAEYAFAHFPVKEYKKNEVFFKEGSVATNIYFVIEGCVRLFYNVDGNEKTAFFFTEGKFLCANESFIKNTIAKENFQALENTTIMLFPKTLDPTIFTKFPNFEMIEKYALIDELITNNRIIESFVTKSPEERYIDLLKTNKALFQRVHQHYIASYLGISPQSLSRIRKRIASDDHN
ncbi:Crp/Fnr family transcriptional regulator [Flammeovirga kamogawensis]|uniref:Crp/Fnr family transcriptional regulator n=1 Tax=Flammeovirga kamogawensis TaxID=373891 RepID=A0ABX8H3C5_9BACT|nr:Crp/Fnr family transcriptional regulator [Flammeovirga kamogawensis]MBB6461988.1 CRP-like cAMP-binding protein [Flammeovirga kamogawensis]QWG10408.1 Crp/Fnr family transcriptional regulator [Flammeovirga kamogawensis]TRX63918.1 Crp/Fnr family transcriptional regulator [Flammeovirga kamogawensis]